MRKFDQSPQSDVSSFNFNEDFSGKKEVKKKEEAKILSEVKEESSKKSSQISSQDIFKTKRRKRFLKPKIDIYDEDKI